SRSTNILKKVTYLYPTETTPLLGCYGLEKEFREDVYRDFELDFYNKGNLYGLEKYWACHHYSKTKDHKKLPELDRRLKEEYRNLNDFKEPLILIFSRHHLT
ncbi:hypothetical protein Tco_1025262, partial [Tanacetum coccineum]